MPCRGDTVTQFVVALVLAVFSALAGYGYGVKDVAQHVQAKWDTEKAEIATEKAATIAAQRAKEAELQSNMDKLRESYSNETSKLSRTVAALNDRVRNRPERPAVPTPATVGDAGGWCSGPQLYREDAALVISESERAEIIRLALIQCQGIYREASGQ